MMPQQRTRSNPSLLSELSLKDLSFRRNKSPAAMSPAYQSIDLNAEDLECFVTQSLTRHVKDTAFFRNLQHQVKQLAKHASLQTDGKLCTTTTTTGSCPYCSSTHLGEIVLSLQTIIQSTPTLSAPMTAQVHSMIGLLRHQKGDLKGAIRSFLRVLWIQSSLKTADPLVSSTNDDHGDDQQSDETMMSGDALVWMMGVTRHRLGMAYGKSGNFADAMTLLQTALQDYETYNANESFTMTRPQRRVVEVAKVELDNFTEARLVEVSMLERKLALARPRRSSTSLAGGNNSPTSRRPVARRSSTA